MKKEKENPSTQKENEMEQTAEKEVFRLPILLLLTALGVISMIEIRAMGWWSLVPLSVNIFLGMQAYEKWEKGHLGFGFMLRGVILMMVGCFSEMTISACDIQSLNTTDEVQNFIFYTN